MKIKSFILLVIAAFALNSCNVDKCDMLCFSGPLSLNFELLDEATGENLFTNGTFGWGTNIVNYTLKIGDVEIFQLILNAEQKTEDCCTFVRVNTLEIKNTEFEQNSETGVYEVLVVL